MACSIATASNVSRPAACSIGSLLAGVHLLELPATPRRCAPGSARCSAAQPPDCAPRMARGSTGPSDTARTGDGLPAAWRQRAIHPAVLRGLAARRAAIPCSPARRNASASGPGEPTASTIARCCWSKSGLSGASDGMQSEEAVEIDGGVVLLRRSRWAAGSRWWGAARSKPSRRAAPRH